MSEQKSGSAKVKRADSIVFFTPSIQLTSLFNPIFCILVPNETVHFMLNLGY